MIATHTPKIFNARLKQQAIRARIINQVPAHLISSQTVNMGRELWAAPQNAAEIKTWREAIQALPEDAPFTPELPGITDTQLKQILVPADDWRDGHYISVSPVASMGVMSEVYRRLRKQSLPHRLWVIQPTPAALANHGEALIMQGGAVRLLRRGPAKIKPGGWRGDFVQLAARCEKMNISSGMVAVGFPAITAIGGMVHAIERSTGFDIQFAVGLWKSDWVSGVPKLTTHKTSYGPTIGRAKGGKVAPVPGYSTEEIIANCEIILLMKSDGDLEVIAEVVSKINRIAGGAIFEPRISINRDAAPGHASYLIDASADAARLLSKSKASDPLDAALKMYGLGGKWKESETGERKWHQPRNGYTANMTGYALLESPTARGGTRGNYPHAWAEPVFSLVTQGSMSDAAWWRRSGSDWGVNWHG